MKGICPNCGKRTGPVDQPCPSDVCRDKGYRMIPEAWYQAAREFAARKRKPLDPLLGRSLDRYLLAGKLGEGGMGSVYLAIQRPLNREVALKVISGLEMTEITIARFEREARAISMLDHPNIVKLHDYGVAELEFQVPYMALEYVKHGRTLARALVQMRREQGGAPIPGDVVLSIFRQVLHALGAAHEIGIIHRDMKPDNVMLAPVHGNPYFVKVLDFGLAKAIADVTGFDGTVTRANQALGTVYYMAPEQAPRKHGPPVVDARADLFAVAIMTYEVFTGIRPFDGTSAIEVMTKKVDPDYDPLSFPEALGLPRPLREFLRRGMAADPERRFANAQEMIAALEGALSGRVATAVGPVAGRPGSSEERPATPASPAVVNTEGPTQTLERLAQPRESEGPAVRTRPSWWDRHWPMLAGVVTILAVAGGVLLAWGIRHTEAPAVSSPEPVAARVPVTASGPPRAPEPVPVPVKEPAPVAPKEPVPERVVVAASPPTARIRVRFESKPAGAQVFAEGRPLGKTPFDGALDGGAGPREFEFRLGGYRAERVRAEVSDGGVVRAVLKREALSAPVRRPKPPARPKKDEYPEP